MSFTALAVQLASKNHNQDKTVFHESQIVAIFHFDRHDMQLEMKTATRKRGVVELEGKAKMKRLPAPTRGNCSEANREDGAAAEWDKIFPFSTQRRRCPRPTSLFALSSPVPLRRNALELPTIRKTMRWTVGKHYFGGPTLRSNGKCYNG